MMSLRRCFRTSSVSTLKLMLSDVIYDIYPPRFGCMFSSYMETCVLVLNGGPFSDFFGGWLELARFLFGISLAVDLISSCMGEEPYRSDWKGSRDTV